MDLQILMNPEFLVQGGLPQQSGPLTVVPLFGSRGNRTFTSPLSGLKLAGVRGYGNVELHNPAPEGVAIVPLHMGFIQDQAQNHALCSIIFLGPGQKRMVEDACCVQQAQGGYLESKEQWFFVLPVQLRAEALRLRGQKNFGKLWPAISKLNTRFVLPQVGHLEQIICRHRPYLTQYQSRLELLPEQTGALFFLGDRLAGVEVAPSAAFFRELWMPLICFSYGTLAMEQERKVTNRPGPLPLGGEDLQSLRWQLQASRSHRQKAIWGWLDSIPRESLDRREEERYLDLRVITAESDNFCGQMVEDRGQLVYASLSARPKYLAGMKYEPGRN